MNLSTYSSFIALSPSLSFECIQCRFIAMIFRKSRMKDLLCQLPVGMHVPSQSWSLFLLCRPNHLNNCCTHTHCIIKGHVTWPSNCNPTLAQVWVLLLGVGIFMVYPSMTLLAAEGVGWDSRILIWDVHPYLTSHHYKLRWLMYLQFSIQTNCLDRFGHLIWFYRANIPIVESGRLVIKIWISYYKNFHSYSVFSRR